MDSTTGGRSGASLTTATTSATTPSSRKEWRAVPDSSSFRSPATSSEETDQMKMLQTDERTIYEEGRRELDVDFCSITIDEGSNESSEDILRQQQIHDISRRRMELQVMEIELRSQVIARSEILLMQNRYEAQIKENATVAMKLKDQLQEKEQLIRDLEMQIEQKELELRAIKIDNEATWVKDDLLREQNEELASFRKERDNSEVERVELHKQIHDLREHIHEKENELLQFKDQLRILQERLLFKEAELREAQAWIASVQMEALQSACNQSLQAELRERTEQLTQYWSYLVQQYTDMERHLLQIIQQLQTELAEAREHNVKDDSQTAYAKSKDPLTLSEKNGDEINENGNYITRENSSLLSSGALTSLPSLVSASDIPAIVGCQSEHFQGILFAPPTINVQPFGPPAQVNASYPFVMHAQGALHSVPTTNHDVSEAQPGHYFPALANTTNQNSASHKQEDTKPTYMPFQTQLQRSQVDEELSNSDAFYGCELSGDGQVDQSDYSEFSGSCVPISAPAVTLSKETLEVPDETLLSATVDLRRQLLKPKQLNSSTSIDSQISTHSVVSHAIAESSVGEPTKLEVSSFEARESGLSASGKTKSAGLLDEKSLLACIVRAIPTGSSGRIRISTTLPNRLGKMLAPLHWHDYEKLYGKIDDYVANHPELFVIQGDYIHLCEGAQKIVSANAAAAKFAAATAASAQCLPQSIVVTPVAQGHRMRRCQSADEESVSSGASVQLTNRNMQPVVTQKQKMNGFVFDGHQNKSDVDIISNSNYLQEANRFLTETLSRKSEHNSSIASVNGKLVDQSGVSSSLSTNGRQAPGRRQRGRS